MARLLDLCAELIICIGSFIRQVDLLNLSLTCRMLRVVTEPELFREFNNPTKHHRCVKPYLEKLIERPELRRHVKRLNLGWWSTWHRLARMVNSQYEPDPLELTPVEYEIFTRTAKENGLISSILPYESKSRVLAKLRHYKARGRIMGLDTFGEEYIYDARVPASKVPYDEKFCRLLRAGVEDPLVVLLLALLPNVDKIQVQEAPCDPEYLRWKAPSHQFKALRTLVANAVCGKGRHLGFLNDILRECSLEEFHCSMASGAWSSYYGGEPIIPLIPLSLEPHSLNLQHLTLQDLSINRSDMKEILGGCRNLRTLFYSSKHMLQGCSPGCTHANMLDFLAPHKGTLEELYLEIDYQRDENAKDSRLKSLTDFAALRVLHTTVDSWPVHLLQQGHEPPPSTSPDPISSLVSFLPRSLTKLTIACGWPGEAILAAQIGEVFRASTTLLPNLRNVLVHNHDSTYCKDLWRRYHGIRKRRRKRHPKKGAAPTPGALKLHILERWDLDPSPACFQDIFRQRMLPMVRWRGEKYALIRRRPSFSGVDRHLFQSFSDLDDSENDDVQSDPDYIPSDDSDSDDD